MATIFPSVGVLQKLLNRGGAGLVADGDFGSRTQTAVTNFQRPRGLAPDGAVGQNTWPRVAANARLPIMDCIDIFDPSLSNLERRDIIAAGGNPILLGGMSNGVEQAVQLILSVSPGDVFLLRFHGHGGPGVAGFSFGHGGAGFGHQANIDPQNLGIMLPILAAPEPDLRSLRLHSVHALLDGKRTHRTKCAAVDRQLRGGTRECRGADSVGWGNEHVQVRRADGDDDSGRSHRRVMGGEPAGLYTDDGTLNPVGGPGQTSSGACCRAISSRRSFSGCRRRARSSTLTTSSNASMPVSSALSRTTASDGRAVATSTPMRVIGRSPKSGSFVVVNGKCSASRICRGRAGSGSRHAGSGSSRRTSALRRSTAAWR